MFELDPARQLFATLPTSQSGRHPVLLTTFRRTGAAVATPVGILRDADTVYFATRSSTGKVKRLCHTPAVTLAPCRRDGTPTGAPISALARRLDGDEARAMERRFFGSLWGRLWLAYFRLRRPHDRWIVMPSRLPAMPPRPGRSS